MPDLNFRPIELSDKNLILRYAYETECRNCDLNFLNLLSWQFLYHTEFAEYADTLLFRFRSVDGPMAYLVPVGNGDWQKPLEAMMQDAAADQRPFLLKGVCENSLKRLTDLCPDCFQAVSDRDYSDYLYLRSSLASLAGKKLQPKRNMTNRFEKNHPDYEYLPLTTALLEECRQLYAEWSHRRDSLESSETLTYEQMSINFVLDHWNELGAMGGVLRTEGKIVAFTYGHPINYDTFGVCVEKADTEVDGAYAMINREFVRRIPEKYIYVNREEDSGIDGLRRAKMAYQPEQILQKFTVRLLSQISC